MSSPVEYLFVDGAYLSKCMEDWSHRFFNDEPMDFKYEQLSHNKFQKTFYYDCLAFRKSGEQKEDYEKRIQPQIEFFNSLRTIPGFHVYQGSTSGEGNKARQKQVDIMMAVHMLSHTIRGNMGKATLIAGDLDFKPLVDALVQEGMYVTLWYQPRNTSKELLYSSDSTRLLELGYFWRGSTSSFLSKHPYPMGFGSSKNPNKDAEKLKVGHTSDGQPAELWWSETNKYMVIYKPDQISQLWMHFSHCDQEILERYLEEMSVKIVWES